MKKRLEKVGQYLKEQTQKQLAQGLREDVGVDALNCALDLGLDRANASKELNRLWKEGKAIKLQGKPVFYLDYGCVVERYPERYIPSILAKHEKLTDFLSEKASGGGGANVTGEDTAKDRESLDSLIGADGSLSEVILNAKSALAYPPCGIDCLIIGSSGTGKTLLAARMHRYACILKQEEVPLVTLYCQNYQEDPALFAQALYGGSRRGARNAESIFARAKGGILVLEQIEALPYSCVSQLANILSQKAQQHGDVSGMPVIHTMIIATTSKTADDPKIASLAQLLPVHLHLQEIECRGIYEKMELIMELFAKEAAHIASAIRVHKDIIVWFAAKRFANNITQMRNEIQLACSKAYLETANPKGQAVCVSYQNLSLSMLSENEQSQKLSANILSLLSCIPSDYLQFDAQGASEALEIFKKAPDMFKEHRLRQFVDEFNININELDDMDRYVQENISVLKDCPSPQLEAIRRHINPYVYQVTMQQLAKHSALAHLIDNAQLLYGILLHISNYLSRMERGGK